MDKYSAWISSLTPLEFTNEKSLEQIIYELIPILLEIKSKQDNDATLFDTFLNDLKKKINDIKTSITTSNTGFRNKEDEIRTNISNKESEITLNILNRFTEILNKINNFGDTYFTNNPDVFTKGILDVAFNTTINDSPYRKWYLHDMPYAYVDRVDEIVNDPPINVDDYLYRYCTSNKQVYSGKNISTYGSLQQIMRFKETSNYQNIILYKKPNFSLGEELKSHTENEYFIGFPDNDNACYFAKSITNGTPSYSIKMINLNTKEITTYENLVMPDNFQDVYLTNNNHYLIKKYHNYYYMFYLKTDNSIPYIAKSNDLVHWTNVGTVGGISKITFRICLDNLYIVTDSFGSYLFNEADNSFTSVKYDNRNVIIIGEINNKIYFWNYLGDNEMYNTINNDLSNASRYYGFFHNLDNKRGIDLTFSKDTENNAYTFLGQGYYLMFENQYMQVIYANTYGYRIKNHNIITSIDFYNNNCYHTIPTGTGSTTIVPFPINANIRGNLVLNENGDIYDDYSLQKLECNANWEYLGR